MTNEQLRPDEHDLRDVLRAMAREDARLAASPQVEERILRAWDARNEHKADSRRRRISIAALAVAASLLLTLAVVRWTGTRPETSPAGTLDARYTSGAVGGATSGLSYETLAWLDADPGSLQIVQLRVPRATLAEQGYAVSDPDGDGMVDIEMVVGNDGMARSVRLDSASAALIY